LFAPLLLSSLCLLLSPLLLSPQCRRFLLLLPLPQRRLLFPLLLLAASTLLRLLLPPLRRRRLPLFFLLLLLPLRFCIPLLLLFKQLLGYRKRFLLAPLQFSLVQRRISCGCSSKQGRTEHSTIQPAAATALQKTSPSASPMAV
jgi:hypothetical protein